MPGRRLLLDTNAIVALLQGQNQVSALVNDASWLGVSIISQLEFLCFPALTDYDRRCFESFLQRVVVVGLDHGKQELIDGIIQIRATKRLKLPDAIIVATTVFCDAQLVPADSQLTALDWVTVIAYSPSNV